MRVTPEEAERLQAISARNRASKRAPELKTGEYRPIVERVADDGKPMDVCDAMGLTMKDRPLVQVLNVVPVPKPRQTRSDKWKKRPCVMRYRAFADAVRDGGLHLPVSGATVKFYLPMPTSWSKKRREEMRGRPHQQRSDLDNLVKSLMDALFADDCRVWDIHVQKFWAEDGRIEIHT